MTYQPTPVDKKDRIVRITNEAATTTATELVTFREQRMPMQVVRLPIAMLMYRMENGRTSKNQKSYIRQNNLPQNYFIDNEENEEAQTAQHLILLELSKDSRGDIYSELRFCHSQSSNLLITHTGVVVNGNRRLAAMRDLLAGPDAADFKEFNFVNCTVLPPTATQSDLEEIESELQEIPETKLQYDWISRRLKMRRRRDELHIPVDKLLLMYRLKSRKDMNREIEQLELAEDYLERYLKRPMDYDAVEKSEQIFKQLQVALESKNGEMEELSRCIAYPLIKEARQLQNRVYQFRFAFGTDAEEVLTRIAHIHKIDLTTSTGATAVSTDEFDSEDPLSGVTEDVTQQQYTGLKPILLNESQSADIARNIAAVTDSIQQEKQDGGRRMIALRNAESANRYLHDIELNGADPTTFPAIHAQLTSCLARANEIIAKLPIHNGDNTSVVK